MSINTSQILASDPGVNAKVSANAGTGKTYVLTARVLRLLLSGVHPSKILCLTYTKAAATEMYERITREMKSWAIASEDEIRQSLAKLLVREPQPDEVKRARRLFTITLESVPPPRIQTIHSFCAENLKRFPIEAGINPNFKVLDEVQASELLKEAKTRLFLKDQNNLQLAAAIEFLSSNFSESVFTDILSEIISRRNIFKAIFETAPEKNFTPLPNEADIKAAFVNGHDFARLRTALAASSSKTDVEKAEYLASKDFDTLSCAFLTAEKEPLKRLATKGVFEKNPGLEDLAQTMQTACCKALEEVLEINSQLLSRHVYHLAVGLNDIYDQLKQQLSALDYNDLLYLTAKLLSNKTDTAWVLYKLDSALEHILVDEAQDTSPEQWQIIKAITDNFFAGHGSSILPKTFFAVGDEKQSIYGFQGAAPENFAAFTSGIGQQITEAQQKWQEIPLKTSYRSVSAVLGLVDKIFNSEHLIHRIGQAGRVELWDIIKRQQEPEHENWHFPQQYFDNNDENLELATKIAETIKAWLLEGRILPSKARKIKPGDILILFQRRGELAGHVIAKLKSVGIPVSGADRLKLKEHIAIQDLLALAKFTLLPTDDLNLACLLKSPLFGISEEELFKLCHNREGSIWQRARQQFPLLEKLIQKGSELDVYEFYSYVLDVLGGRKKIIARLGHEASEVLDEFLDLCIRFEKNYVGRLQKFVHAMESSEIEIRRDLEQGQNEVRVMTVHGAKGLQAPIVFLADSGYMPDMAKERIYFADGFVRVSANSKANSSYVKALKEQKKEEDFREYLRLLYVAMTRAEDELHICASEGRNKLPEDCWYNIITGAMEGQKLIETTQEAPVTPPVQNLAQSQPAALPEYLFKTFPYKQQQRSRKFESSLTREGRRVHKALEHASTHENPLLAEIFTHGLAEVGIAGMVDERFREGRIDRLLVKDSEVWVVDFKTTETPPASVPSQYISQLNFYEKLLADIYKGKKIRKFILWTATNALAEV